MKRARASEAEVAAPVVAHLEKLGLDVYQEVPCWSSGGIADIVALAAADSPLKEKLLRAGRSQRYLLGDEDWIVEVKASWSLDLLDQCLARKKDAHRVFAAVPDGKEWRDRAVLFSSLGIGTIRVRLPEREVGECMCDGDGEVKAPRPGCSCITCVTAREPPTVAIIDYPDRSLPVRGVRIATRPEHKTHAKAGQASGAGVFHWSPWRQTCANLLALVTANPEGITAVEASTKIEHHYPSAKHARRSLIAWTREGKVSGVGVKVVGGLAFFFPKATTP